MYFYIYNVMYIYIYRATPNFNCFTAANYLHYQAVVESLVNQSLQHPKHVAVVVARIRTAVAVAILSYIYINVCMCV